MRRLRVLLLAESCNPEWFSVPLVAWSHYRALSCVCDVHLVTQVRNREALGRAGLVERRDYTCINTEFLVRPALKLSRLLGFGDQKGWTLMSAVNSMAYPVHERLVWERFGRRLRAGEFDIVHRLNPGSPTYSSSLAPRCASIGVPFVMGPLNGGLPWAPQFADIQRQEREWLSRVRGAYKLLPGYRSTWQHASAVLIASNATWDQVPARHRGKCFYVPENAIDPSRFTPRDAREPGRPLKVVFVGRLVPLKGVDMLLDAAAPLVKSGGVRVTIVGDGPHMAALRELVRREGIEQGVELPGWVEHAKVQTFLRDADMLAFPSVHDFGGGAILEAMVMGLVPVVVDYGGPGELVTEGTGYKVPMTDRAGIMLEFRRVLGELVRDPSPLKSKSRMCLRRAREQFTWAVKARQVMEVYHWALDPRRPRPDFPRPTPDPAEGG